MTSIAVLYPSLLTSTIIASPPAKDERLNLPSAMVTKVTDGDTIELAGGRKIRLFGINTPEKGEAGYEDAKRALGNLVGFRTVFYQPVKKDGYGRTVARLYVRDLNGDFIDVCAEMIKKGLAHVFWFENTNPKLLKEYLALQDTMRTGEKGIWMLATFQGALHITSFHANGRGDDDKYPNVEYMRIANVTGKAVDLSAFTLIDYCKPERKFPLPSFILPAGWSVAVRSGIGKDQSDPAKGELAIHLNSGKQIWEDKGAKVKIVDGRGKVVDYRSSKKAFHCNY